MTSKRDYTTESIRLSKAIDIAIEAFKKHPPKDFTNDNLEHVIKIYSDWKFSVLNPEPKFKKLASLNYHVHDVFNFFQESTGKAVDFFWQQINENNLGYIREDKLRKILDRGKIKGRIEYEYVIDLITAAQQEGRMTNEETKRLGQMLADFEKGKNTKKLSKNDST